jgi:hypothetical protein
MTLCLTRDELVDLTDYRRRDKQRAALVSMGVRFRIAPTGAIKVLRSDLELVETRDRRRGVPDLEAI